MKHLIILAMALLLLFTKGCVKSLSSMPAYDFDQAMSVYPPVSEIQSEYFGILQGLAILPTLGVQMSDADAREITIILDRYIWWKAVADIHVFYGEYEAMNIAVIRAKTALAEVRTKVEAIVTSSAL